ncbi:MAG: phospholipid carrier-dependent glycosyltransferase, partial [Cyanobacteria bacterium P01_H01_bin.15]
MAPRNFVRPQLRPWLILLGIWLVTVFCDRVWWGLDHQVPAWDQADYLNGALNYWRALQTPDWFNSDWWREFWLLSTKIPPLNYILTALTCFADGTLTLDRATWLFAFYSGALFVAIFELGTLLFSSRVGLWAAAFCALMPGLVRYRLDYVLDFPVTAGIIVSFAVFTCLHLRTRNEKGMGGSSWLWALVWGISFGLALLIKQTAVLFLLGPMLGFLRPWRWRKLGQLLLGLFVTATLAYPWFRTNWLLVLTGSKRATIDSAIAEGDPSLLSLDAWTYYLKVLSMAIAWPIWIFVGLSLLWFAWRYRAQLKISSLKNFTYQWRWLSLFLLSGYFLSSLNINKDPRYVLPLLPIVCLVLARAWVAVCDHNSWLRRLSFVALGLTSVLWLSGSFPLGNPEIA